MIVVDGVVQEAIVDHLVDLGAVMRRDDRFLSVTNGGMSTTSCAGLPDLIDGNARQLLGHVLNRDTFRVRCDNERDGLCNLALSRVRDG